DASYTDPSTGCQNIIPHTRNSTELENIRITITDLKPYRNYSITVAAINEAGRGLPLSKDFTTQTAAPFNLESVNVMTFRSIENKGGMNITIAPGEYTGPTTFYVCLKASDVDQYCKYYEDTYDKDVNYHSHSYTKSPPFIVTLSDLLAFWNYTIEVQANTTAGTSNWVVKNESTPTNVPGEAQFFVIPDSSIATNLTINIRCPDKIFRNGIITKFTVNVDNGTKTFNQTIQASEGCEKNSTKELQDIIAEQNYSIRVIVHNTDFSSPFSKPLNIYVYPKAPIFSMNGLEIKQQGSDLSTSQAKVILSLKLLLNSSQGKLADISLVICADVPGSKCKSENRRKRETNIVEKFNHTWLESSKQGFIYGYRATPIGWLEKLQGIPSNEYTYTIGEETCGSTASFCNGPLPSNTKFSVIIIVCTAGDCGYTSPINLQTKAEENNTPAIVGGVVGGILGLALIIAVVFLIIYFKRRPHSARPSSSSYVDLIKRDENIKEHRPVRITEFKDHVKKLHKDSNLLFQDEFEDIKKLSSRLPNICDEAKKENNRVKNRYVDILPYDSSRVKLEVQPEDDETMDFINANYIPGYNSVREYIATQGPMHSTVPDFWRMVWEQKCRVIVMLSDLTEQGKPKVTLYWPENLGEPINYGNVIVEMTNFSQLNKYIIRNFKIAKGSETRKVTHFFLPGWWDFSANLTTGDVLEFAQLVRQEATPANSGPIIVHCSAGVGRTGTFIALDYFMQYIEKHSLLDSVDVFSYVMKMRAARPRMVQAETQYIFIFDALDEVIDRKIKIEQEKNEHLYSNGGGNDVYANMVKAPEESIYANTQVINEKNGIDNKAFESDYENLTLSKTNQPTTVL
uniref:protein-tyrosine-phosphatase n=1 Tax=Biomphalaria glabrata TaxID=6526 RepID=A0A9I3W236_BIOGL